MRTIKGKLESMQHLLESEGKLYSFEHGQIARWTEEAYGKKAALSAYADYHARYPYLSEGRFHHGRLLLANGDDKGIAVLEEMLGTEPLYRQASIRALADYHLRRRRTE